MNLSFVASRSSSLSQRSCSLSRSTSSSSKDDGFDVSPASSNGKLAVVSIAIITCALCVLLQTSHHHGQMESALGRRDWKNIGTISRDTVLQQKAVLAIGEVKQTILRAQGATIALLQQRYDRERTARSRAQFDLSLQLQSLTKCAAEFEEAEREVLQCANGIRDQLGIPRRSSL